jgi:predicted ferric reductase
LHAPSLLLYAGLPLAAFAVERGLRARVRGARVAILDVEALRSGVTRIELERPAGFVARAGDYAYLNLPQLARHEWHPFTISSAPECDTLVFHVRSLGNFTSALRQWAERSRAGGGELGTAQLDGPHGTPSGRIFASRHVVLIGAGIGVTPFASVLESVVLRGQDAESQHSALEKVHFFWLNRDQYSFEWFAELLAELEHKDRGRLLDLHICMTGGRTGATAVGLELARRAHHAQGAPDVVTGLSQLTRMGHPDWQTVLSEIVERHAPDRVEVFFCGPLGLGKKLSAICERLQMGFHEERF